jgi:A/G-specific adenine glycosylase
MNANLASWPDQLLRWYDQSARTLPWRAPPGSAPPDPYRVWLSEIMLQQTTVAAVVPYFQRFVTRWPTVEALAAAPVADVLAAWAGLGYYSRARNLHACAVVVMRDHGGAFPPSEAHLRRLPGIGTYTAAAIAAIAFGEPAAVVDGNVERVIARLLRQELANPALKEKVRQELVPLVPGSRPGDFAQALMDLGATICTPRQPACDICPLAAQCQARQQGDAAAFPRKLPKPAKPHRYGVVYWLEAKGKVLLERRPDKGLLGGMLGLPTSEWTLQPPEPGTWPGAPRKAEWVVLPQPVEHVFTHFSLTLTVAVGNRRDDYAGFWLPIEQIHEAGLPTVFRKAVLVVSRSVNVRN